MVDFKQISDKWQKAWEGAGIFRVTDEKNKKKFYVLEMFPYPSSGRGLHMGHVRNYTIGDVYTRFKRMNGFNVLYPMGYDSFGLPAENAAIKAKSHPKLFTEKAIESFIRQQKELGLSYDWTRMFATHTPEYYRWDQWIFLKMLEKGLAYKKKAAVNWCPKCATVLANEQVHNGKCWRHTDTEVELKELNQWFLKITDYADELLKGHDDLKGWQNDVILMQKNWIGKSHGTLVEFPLDGSDEKVQIFTTRPDTLWGVTFMVYAPEHPKVMELIKGTEDEAEVKKFISKVVLQDRFQRTAEDKEKEGMFIGKYAINPLTKEKIPIYIANFVLMDYGTGAIMAVPTHDQRDFEFAKKYNIPLKVVINPHDYELNSDKMSRAYLGDGILTNSGDFTGENNREAIPGINKYLEKEGFGKATVQYKLRDWLISRQRFWGCPIPIIYCGKCGTVPVPESELPVKLPDDFKFENVEGNPLEQCKEFTETRCPICGEKARRETDTMDTFVDSSWYFLRYTDPNNSTLPFSKDKADYWMPVDMYIGGKEHATMHLIYFRFFTKFLADLGLTSVREPAPNLFNQGMLHKGGFVMSKSRGNVVSQEEISEKYGIDTARFFLMFVASPDKDMEWDDNAVEGSYRFLKKLYTIATEKELTPDNDPKQLSKLHKTIKEVTEGISEFRYNLALISIMSLTNYLHVQDKISREVIEKLLLIISPFTPHLGEELWEKLGNKPFISQAKWPGYDQSLIDEKLEAEEELIINTNADITRVLELIKVKEPKEIKLIISPGWKYALFKKVQKLLETTRDPAAIMKECVLDESLKKHGKDISKLVPALLKDTSKIPKVILDPDTDFNNLQDSIEKLEKHFRCTITVEKSEDSKEQKARQAMPGKPAIIVQ